MLSKVEYNQRQAAYLPTIKERGHLIQKVDPAGPRPHEIRGEEKDHSQCKGHECKSDECDEIRTITIKGKIKRREER